MVICIRVLELSAFGGFLSGDGGDVVDGVEDGFIEWWSGEGVEAIVELGDGSCADDGGGDAGVAEGPLEGEVVEGHALGGGEVAEGGDFLLLGFDLVGAEEAFGACGA
jgi:hypothetical protein